MYYPAADKRGDKQTFQAVGPKPTTFSGRRALDQVLTNPGGIDKSIVMDIELLDVGAGGAARRGPGHIVSRRGVTTDTQWGFPRGQAPVRRAVPGKLRVVTSVLITVQFMEAMMHADENSLDDALPITTTMGNDMMYMQMRCFLWQTVLV